MDMTVQRISLEDLEEAKDLVSSLEESNLFQDAL
jgi:hypothetical protein